MDDDEVGGDVKDEKLWMARGGFGQCRSSKPGSLCPNWPTQGKAPMQRVD